ncbi:unnamed protein product [Lactuca saligna]|uniref:Uncharacterized protein n=1 Tax=Lactuca saligna TaxID=75948 RepID=A0AA35YHY8_LACSI|nr:unnamed protein product [Lactuca saligna]
MEVAVEQAAQSRSRRSKWQFMGTSDAGAKEELHRVYCAKEDLLPIPCFSQLLSYDSNSELPPAVSYFGDEYTFNLETQETLVHSKSHLFYAVVYLPQKVSDSMLVSRTTWEGGQYNRDEKSRLDALCLAMELGADHIDVELQVPFFSVGANGAAGHCFLRLIYRVRRRRKRKLKITGIGNWPMRQNRYGDLKLATYLSKKNYTGAHFYRNGVPSLLALPPGCKSSDCIVRFGVEEAPIIVILRDPDVKPVVYHGSINNSRLIDVMEQNKHEDA